MNRSLTYWFLLPTKQIDGPYRDTLEAALTDRNYIIEFFARQRAKLIPNTRAHGYRMKAFLRSKEYDDMVKSRGELFTADMYKETGNDGSEGDIELE